MALAKCGHPGCACLPADHSPFCSDHCEEVHLIEPPEEVGCLCGHTGCDPRAVHHDTESDIELIELPGGGAIEPRH